MAPNSPLLGRLGLTLAAAVGLYGVLLGVLLTPPIQRFALYAHKLNTLFLGDDLNNGEEFGFAKNQVTPFNIRTPDGETLYAWHILPLDVYARNQKAIVGEERSHGPVADLTKTSAFEHLTDRDARVVVTFHGNAGHIAQGWRASTYRNIVAQPNTHVLTIDYRGFGYSTGSPTEAGLIADATTLVDWTLQVAGIPPERIVILGQSLGTAVSSAVALHFADPTNELIPSQARELREAVAEGVSKPTTFAGVILAAPFSSLPSLMLTYRVGGLLPILLPLRPFPYLAGLLTSQMVDKWLSAERLEAYYGALLTNPQLLTSIASGRSMGSLQLFHSLRDMDIPYHQTEMICRRMFGEGQEPGVYDQTQNSTRTPVDCIDGSQGAAVLDVKVNGGPRVRFEIIEYGGHNRLVTYIPITAAVTKAFEDLFD